MPLNKRAKRSHPSTQLPSRFNVADGAAASDDEDEDVDEEEDDDDAEPDDVEVEEDDEGSEDSDDCRRKVAEGSRPSRTSLEQTDEDLNPEVDDDDEDEDEEVEIVEVVEEEESYQGEVEEEEEVEGGGGGGGGRRRIREEYDQNEEETGPENDENEEGNGSAGSDMESVEEDAESVDNDAGILKQPQVSVNDAEQNARGNIDDAEEEYAGSVTNRNYYFDHNDSDNEEDDDDECSSEDHAIVEVNNNDEDRRRKLLAVLMCMSSLQTLMAVELCRDTTYPFDQIMKEDSNMFTVSFLKLTVLAIASLMREQGWQCLESQRPGQGWAHVERGVSSIDSATRDSIWRRKYSMSYGCFLYLVDELRPFLQSEAHMHVRVPLEIERAVAMVLYRLAHGLSAREVAEKYDVGASTVKKYTLIVASALSDASKLYGRYIAIPTGNRIVRIISQFQQITNVSQVCGAIDCMHIKLYIKPDKWHSSSGYQSPPKPQSILLQAVCDANKLFWDVCCMAPGNSHEAAHFVTSNLYQKVKDGLSLKEPVLILENKEVTPLMVGDHAYPSRSFLIKPFEADDALRKAFDEQLQRGLACINDAFAILKTRWKVLRCMNVHLMHAPRIAVACCILHNICQVWREPEPPHEQSEQNVNEHSHGMASTHENDEASRIAGEAIREALFRDWVKRSLDSPYVSVDQESMSTGQT